MIFHNFEHGSPEDQAQHDAYYRFLPDWYNVDFYKYNPANDLNKIMDYHTYYLGRMDGSIPAPDPKEVQFRAMNPIHNTMTSDGVYEEGMQHNG